MDSKYLLQNGFKIFGEFNRENIKSRKHKLNFTAVYVFVLDVSFLRLNGVTDILYIGQAGSRNARPLYARMMDYCNAYASAPQDKRIGDSLQRVKTKVRVGRALRDISVNNKVFLYFKEVHQTECKDEEQQLLNRYSRDHIELPPLNRSGQKNNYGKQKSYKRKKGEKRRYENFQQNSKMAGGNV